MDWDISQVLLAISATCILLDACFKSDVLTCIAYALAAFAFVLMTPVALMWKFPLVFAYLAVIISLHFVFWKTTLQPWLHSKFAPQMYAERAERVIGGTGELVMIEGRRMVRVDDELWPCSGCREVSPGSRIMVLRVNGGVAECSPIGEP